MKNNSIAKRVLSICLALIMCLSNVSLVLAGEYGIERYDDVDYKTSRLLMVFVDDTGAYTAQRENLIQASPLRTIVRRYMNSRKGAN